MLHFQNRKEVIINYKNIREIIFFLRVSIFSLPFNIGGWFSIVFPQIKEVALQMDMI